jgi:hypothetical protein
LIDTADGRELRAESKTEQLIQSSGVNPSTERITCCSGERVDVKAASCPFLIPHQEDHAPLIDAPKRTLTEKERRDVIIAVIDP